MKWSGWIVLSLAAFAVTTQAAEPRVPARLARTSLSRLDDPKAAAPAPITPHAPVHYKQATWDIWSGTSTGYVYAPGACDYTPPCVNHLWDGYVQHPHRCDPIQLHGFGHGCGACGNGGYGGCNSCGMASSCSDMVPSCAKPTCAMPTCAAPSCAWEGGKGSDAPAPPAPADAAPPKPTVEEAEPVVEAPLLDKTSRSNRLRGFTVPDTSLQR